MRLGVGGIDLDGIREFDCRLAVLMLLEITLPALKEFLFAHSRIERT
jgi:hypothetical protein